MGADGRQVLPGIAGRGGLRVADGRMSKDMSKDASYLRREVAARGPDWLARAGDRYEGSRTEAGGRKVLCPWHTEERPSCQLTPVQDDVSAHCFSCGDRHGTSLDFLSACWGTSFPETCERLSSLLGTAPAPTRTPAAAKTPPPQHELQALWEASRGPLEGEEELRARGLDAEALGAVLRLLPEVGTGYRWARFGGEAWGAKGHRWLLQVWGPDGALVSLHARALQGGADPKGLQPIGAKVRGGVLANAEGRRWLEGAAEGDLVICEGVPDFLTLVQLLPGRPIWGLPGAGVWSTSLAERIPAGSHVLLWTHQDEGGAGQKYRAQIVSSLPGRKVRTVVIEREAGTKKGKDANDLLREGGPAAVLGVLEGREDDEAWRTGLLWNSKGGLQKGLANAVTLLGRHPAWAGVLAYDELSGHITTRKAPPWYPEDAPKAPVEGGRWGSDDTARAQAWLERSHGLGLASGVVEAAVRLAAQQQGSYHPVREYLGALQWDGASRLDSFFEHYFGASGPHLAIVGVWWFISAVARVYKPGCQVDHTIILEGPQGIGKSTALSALCPRQEWFFSSKLEIGHKDAYQVIRSRWIVVLDEIAAFKGKAWEEIKQYLTAPFDVYRPTHAKGHEVVEVPRQQIFAGATNSEDGYIDDPTGGRRIWPVQVRRIDREGVARDRDQLWAEARARYEAGQRWWPETAEEVGVLAAQQQERQIADPLQDDLALWLASEDARRDAPNGLPMAQILAGAGYPATARDKRLQGRAAPILRALGWERRQVGGERVKRWFRA